MLCPPNGVSVVRSVSICLVAVFGGSLLISSCDQSRPVPQPSLPETRASAAQATSDARRVTYELREKCGRDAMDWFKHFHEGDEVPAGLGIVTTQNEYNNHYNEKLNRCYALVLNTQLIAKGLCALNTMSLVDVNENSKVGDYFKNCKAPTPIRCSVAGEVCTSQEQFEQLVAPYLTN
jgi:hypothetical protein